MANTSGRAHDAVARSPNPLVVPRWNDGAVTASISPASAHATGTNSAPANTLTSATDRGVISRAECVEPSTALQSWNALA